jgi:hypothetical protein
MKNIFLVLGLSVYFATPALYATPSCNTPGSDRMTCLQMKHLRSHLDLFDAQRDLLQTNYPLIEQLSTSMNSILTNILVDPNRAAHFAPLGEIKKLSAEITTLAHKQDIEALKKTNLVRQKCQQCHAAIPASTSQNWEELSKQGWINILNRCNQFDRNPYVCKNMFAMAGVLNFIQSGEDSSNQTFQSLSLMTTELRRIIADLKTKNAVHGGQSPLVEIEKRAIEVETLVLAKDPKAYDKATSLVQACAQCHGPGHR